MIVVVPCKPLRLFYKNIKTTKDSLTDKRIREWCFGSLDGGYDGELWGVVPRILAFKSYEDMMTTKITYRELANAIIEADTADWAEPYEVIRDRVWSGFEDIAHHREKMVAAKSWWFPMD